MKANWILLTIIGTILPNIFVCMEMIDSGNIMLYRYPIDTFNGMFANNISSAFATDLLFIVLLFLVWSFYEAKKLKMKNIVLFWVYTFLFGIAGGLPLFMYFREKKSKTKKP